MLKLVTLKDNLNLNIIHKIYDFKSPSKIYIPIFNNDIFKMNEYIEKNTFFGNYIASISGYIKGSKEIKIKNKNVLALEIENDFKENSTIKNKKVKVNTVEELIDLLNAKSLQTIGQKFINHFNLKNLIISSIDEEESSFKEFIRLSNNYMEILDTIDFLVNILKISQAILVTKNTNFKSIKNVKSIIGTYPNIKVNLVPNKYLIGYKPFLCKYLNIQNDETIELTTNEIYNIYKVLKGKFITEQLITISGNAIEKSLAIDVRLNTSLEEVLNEYIKITDNNNEVFINGNLKGYKIKNIQDIIITKDIDSIVINKKEVEESTDCINCGACLKICPVNINVKKCYLKKLSHNNCIGCGLCEYICPAKIKLKKIVKGNIHEK